ncbi:MAG: ABC transporter ATP-binding protein [Clostridia bacterium]|nr:ABC transporter ATP-binding protein [Clostridia bacterium]
MIRVEHLTKRFDGFVALNDISCNIQRGCIYGMVGSNGAGKSTFLRLLSGIYQADGGSVTLDDQPVWENPEVKMRIGFVPDELYFLSGANMERMAALQANTHPTFDAKRYRELAAAFRLDVKKPLSQFSKGMRRQAALLMTIACRPDYLFFDETFDGLDPVMRKLVKSLICQDVAERGATAIITSHSLRELEDTCDQLALLHRGGLVFERDIGDLKTSLLKVQVAFSTNFSREDFPELDVLHFVRHGSVVSLIVRGEREEVEAALKARRPLLLDLLPLTLEEVFTYEMEALGYSFEDLWEGIG